MFGWFNRKKESAPNGAAALENNAATFDLQQRLELVLQNRAKRSAEPKAYAELQSEHVELDLNFQPANCTPGEETCLAAALENILQGAKVEKEVFIRLYRSGYVQKDDGCKWRITEAGKQLIECKKVYGEGECRIGGVVCAKDWQTTARG